MKTSFKQGRKSKKKERKKCNKEILSIVYLSTIFALHPRLNFPQRGKKKTFPSNFNNFEIIHPPNNNEPHVSSYNLLGIYLLSSSSGMGGVKTRCIIRSGINTSSVARLCPINHWPSTFRQSKLQPSRVIDKPDLRYCGANNAILRHQSRTSRRVLSGKLRAEIGVFVFRR